MRNIFWDDRLDMLSLTGFLTITLGIVIVFIIIGTGLRYFISCKKAEVFNELNNTSYTCSQFFWAKDQINSSTQTLRIK